MDFSLTSKNIPLILLGSIFVFYLLMNYPLPEGASNLMDTLFAKIVILVIAVSLFKFHPVLGIIGLLVAYKLITSASIRTGMAGLSEYYPTEEKKWSPFSKTHQFPYTLEEEMVKTMTSQNFNETYVKAPYRPKLNDTHDAAPLISMKTI